MNTIAYPRLIKRVRAALIDSVLIPIAAIGTLILGSALGVSHPAAKTMLLIGPIFCLEPGMVAVTGGTIGHHLQRIRVTAINGTGKINIADALLRFTLKFMFGWLSFIFALTTSKHQAVHDLLAGSLVVHKSTRGLPAFEILAERKLDHSTYIYPPAWRRIIVIIGYLLVVTVMLAIITIAITSNECFEGNRCTGMDKLIEIFFSLCWLLSTGWLVVHGWNGSLRGCRRRNRESIALASDPDTKK